MADERDGKLTAGQVPPSLPSAETTQSRRPARPAEAASLRGAQRPKAGPPPAGPPAAEAARPGRPAAQEAGPAAPPRQAERGKLAPATPGPARRGRTAKPAEGMPGAARPEGGVRPEAPVIGPAPEAAGQAPAPLPSDAAAPVRAGAFTPPRAEAPMRAEGLATPAAAPRPAAPATPPAARQAPPRPAAPRLYLVNPLLVGGLADWDAVFAHIAGLGFDTALLAPVFAAGEGGLYHIADPDQPHPALAEQGDSAALLAALAGRARAQGLALHLDLVLDRIAAQGALAAAEPHWFDRAGLAEPPDPRRPPPELGSLRARWEDPAVAEALGGWWEARLRRFAEAGVSGFRCLAPDLVPQPVWRRLMAALPQCRFLAWTPGLPAEALSRLAGAGFAAGFSSLAWWRPEGGWLAAESRRLAAFGPAIATLEPPFGPRLAATWEDPVLAERAARRQLVMAAGTGAGMLMPMGFEFGAHHTMDAARDRPGDWAWLRQHPEYALGDAVRAANAALARQALAAAELRPLTAPGAPVVALLRREPGGAAPPRLVLANAGVREGATVALSALLPSAGGDVAGFRPWPEGGAVLGPAESLRLAPGEALLFEAEATRPVLALPHPAHVRRGTPDAESAFEAARAERVAIEAVTPAVDGGRFAVKRMLGEVVAVECDLICDGHDKLGGALQWRAADEEEWQEVRLQPLTNDRWVASFPLTRLGRHVFRIEAWRDAFATFRDELAKKHAAGLTLTLELEEGRRLVQAAGERAGGAVAEMAARLAGAADAERLHWLLSPELAGLMAAADDRPFLARSAEMPLEAERTAAAFASWYEVFPRSQSGDPQRHGTFRDVIRRLPHIRAMGFDVLYFPPIHPIGRKNRKGRNNSLTPGPEDPGSPYAIGSEAGGHDAIHPELGTLEDFLALREAAARHGLELALDFAIQCSPDHPWLREHKDWFDWRPDGTIRYAENPPKKYEDIVNVDFYAPGAVPTLWLALRDVVLFWARQGVRLFRVDNPHTKPLPFWEWMIAEVRGHYPDAVFLAEAFTKPKMMYRLAKIGFGQSYTYFTWRNTKAEMQEYMTELTTTAPRDFFRPHFFVNTPDINPHFLQTSGRPGFLIRAALAATLAGLWGVFQGFELCEAQPVPGREEYWDSDKYEIRARPDRAPGDIVEEITRLNAIRRANPALHSHLGLAFHNAFNDQMMWYRKQNADRSNVLLVAVSMDPHHVQEATVELPLWEWGLPDHAALEAEDLMRGHRFTWHGKTQRLRLDPHEMPFGIWRVRPAGGAA